MSLFADLGAVGTLLGGAAALAAFIEPVRRWRQDRLERKHAPGEHDGTNAPAGQGGKQPADLRRRRLGKNAWLSADFGLGAWAFTLLLVILVTSTKLGLGKMPLIAIFVVIGVLASLGAFFGVLALVEPGGHRGPKLHAGSGLVVAAGAVVAMLIVGGS